MAECNTIHPVRDYFGGLTWDGVERLDEMLTSYFGALSDPYTRAVGSRWMISAVARVMAPGCQADCMIVLEGRQGTGKSTGLEALASQEWFADTGISIGEKDSYQALRGVWIYELGELDSLRGREATRTKMFLSARTDTYRPSYGRRTRNFPRQTVFAGSTNESEYLVDKTGNRRFWPIRCGAIDVAAIRRDRDQLWAEALVRYKQGDAWHLNTPELCRLADAAQEARETEDPWVLTIDRWLTSLSPVVRLEGITTDMVLAALQVPAASQHHGAVTRAGQAMRALGWEPQQLRRGGARVRIYRPAQPAQPDTAGTEADGVTGSPLENKGNTHLSHPSQAHALYAGTRRGESLNAIMCRDGRAAVTPAALEAAQEGFDFDELEAFEADQGVR